VACDEPVRQCIEWTIRPRTTRPTEPKLDEDDKWGFSCCCPAHDDRKRSLHIGEGKQRRIVWFCHAGCTEAKVRHALITAGIPAGCLPRSAKEHNDLEEAIRAILTSDLGHAAARLHALALLDEPGGKLPRGAALDSLAAQCGVSRRGAYRALSPRLPSTDH
jgi:DNA-binding phage protein